MGRTCASLRFLRGLLRTPSGRAIHHVRRCGRSKEDVATLGHRCKQPELAVDPRQVTKVFAVAESAVFLIIVSLCVLIPENVESVKERLGTPEQKITELRFAIWIEADDLTIENAAATP